MESIHDPNTSEFLMVLRLVMFAERERLNVIASVRHALSAASHRRLVRTPIESRCLRHHEEGRPFCLTYSYDELKLIYIQANKG